VAPDRHAWVFSARHAASSSTPALLVLLRGSRPPPARRSALAISMAPRRASSGDSMRDGSDASTQASPTGKAVAAVRATASPGGGRCRRLVRHVVRRRVAFRLGPRAARAATPELAHLSHPLLEPPPEPLAEDKELGLLPRPEE